MMSSNHPNRRIFTPEQMQHSFVDQVGPSSSERLLNQPLGPHSLRSSSATRSSSVGSSSNS